MLGKWAVYLGEVIVYTVVVPEDSMGNTYIPKYFLDPNDAVAFSEVITDGNLPLPVEIAYGLKFSDGNILLGAGLCELTSPMELSVVQAYISGPDVNYRWNRMQARIAELKMSIQEPPSE